MEFDIITNAMDSLEESIAYYSSGKEKKDERSFKFCIMLLCQCAELLLKEILRSQHDILVFEDIDKPRNKNEVTVGFSLAIDRVKNICQIDLGGYEGYLRDLANTRNQIQHYKFSISEDRCMKIITESFSAIEYIFHHILKNNFVDYEDYVTCTSIDYIHKDQDIRKKKLADITRDITAKGKNKFGIEYKEGKWFLYPCPNCAETALINEGTNIVCKYCGERYGSLPDFYNSDSSCIVEKSILRDIGRKKHLLSYGVFECNSCENVTMIFSDVEKVWVCLLCGLRIEDTFTCDDCGNEVPGSDGYLSLVQSYLDTEDYHYLCTDCLRRFKDSEEYGDYEVQ